jgi:hypothetical protein
MKKIIWNDADIDAAYLMGVVNASCHEIDINDTFPTLAIVSKEIDRLKSLGYKRPYEAIIILREKKEEEIVQFPCKTCGKELTLRGEPDLHKARLSEYKINMIIEEAKKDGKTLYKYYCPHCFGYHLTKKLR